MEELNFDSITLIEVPVTIAGKKYVLREADGNAAIAFRNAQLQYMHFSEDGKPQSMQGMAATETLLVSLCLVDEAGANVPEQVIRKWPNRIQKTLYERAREISELDDDTEEALEKQMQNLQRRLGKLRKDSPKNEPSGTPAG